MKFWSKRENKDAEIASLRGKIAALEAHISFLNNHVERHSNNRKLAEDRMDEVSNKLVGYIAKLSKSGARTMIDIAERNEK